MGFSFAVVNERYSKDGGTCQGTAIQVWQRGIAVDSFTSLNRREEFTSYSLLCELRRAMLNLVS